MNSLAKSLVLALTALAVASLFVLGSPAKQASAEDDLCIEQVCGGVEGTFILEVYLDVDAQISVEGQISLVITNVSVEPTTVDIDDLVQALLEGLSPLRIEVGCGQTIDNILSVVLDAVGGLTLSIED